MKAFDIKKILVPVDFSGTSLIALEHAKKMAKLCEAEIILLHVEEKSGNLLFTKNIGGQHLQIENRLDDLVKESGKNGIKVISLMLTGKPRRKIVQAADQYHADLIIMGTNGSSGFEEFFVGSNAFGVVNDANVPVLSIRPNTKVVGFDNIMLPIDKTLHSHEKIHHAAKLAKFYDATLHLVAFYKHDEDPEELRVLRKKIAQDEEFFRRKGVAYISEIHEVRSVAKGTMEYAEKLDVDLIIIMTEQQENAFSDLFLGPAAQQIVNHSRIPVMSIRPEIGELIGNSFSMRFF